MTNFLKVSKAIGLENFTEMKEMIRSIRDYSGFPAYARIKLKSCEVDAFQKFTETITPPKAHPVIEKLKSFLPKSENIEHFLDITVRKYGENSGTVTIANTSRNGQEVIEKSKLKALGNETLSKAYKTNLK